MNKRSIALTLLALLFFAVPAFAQRYVRGGYWDNRRRGYHASTIGESHANGVSNLIRSRATANLTNSQAALNYTEVRSRQLDNRLKTASTYFEMRRINNEARFGTPEEKAAKRAYNQERFFRYAQAGSPNRPPADSLDPITGKIKWPFTFMPDKYADYREELEKVFAQRAKHGGYLSFDEYTAIKQNTDGMLTLLRGDIRNIPSQEYVRAKNFVEALIYEADHSNT